MDEFQNWRDRIEGKTVPIVTDMPQSGYYKMRRSKDGPWLPVAIWTTEEGQICRVADEKVDPLSVWHWCAKHPVDKDAAKVAFATGKWGDMPTERAPSNMPSDPYEALLAEINDKTEQAEAWLAARPKGAQSKEDADLGRNMEAQIQALQKRADEMHKAEKAPHLEASRNVDQRFDFRKAMDPLKKSLKAAWGAFAVAEEKRLRAEAEAKAAAERKAVEAERARIEAEQKKLMEEDPIAALTSTPEPLPELPKVEEVKVSVGGGVGSRGGLTTVWIAEVTDYAAAAAHYANQAAVRELIDKIANGQAKRDKETAKAPGVKFSSERRAR